MRATPYLYSEEVATRQSATRLHWPSTGSPCLDFHMKININEYKAIQININQYPKASPLPSAPPGNQLTGDWQLWVPKPDIWKAWSSILASLGCILVPWGTISMILGSPGTPDRTPCGPDVNFDRLGMDLGILVGYILVLVCRLFHTWDHQVAVWVSGLVFL